LKGFIDYVDGSVNLPVRSLPKDITGQLVLANSTVANSSVPQDPKEGCEPFTNPEDVKGKIVLVYRGDCFFVDKIANAEKAGATGVIVVNKEGTGLFNMFVASDVPAVMISFEDGEKLRKAIESGQNVTLKLGPNTGQLLQKPNADKPVGLGTISLADIKAGKQNLTITPHTQAFKWYTQNALFDLKRNLVWIIGVDDNFNQTKVYDLKGGFDNLTVVGDIEQTPFDFTYGFFSRDNKTYLVDGDPDGLIVQYFNVTDLNNITVAVNVSTLNDDAVAWTSNGSTLYANNGPVFSSDVAVFDTANFASPKRVLTFKATPEELNNTRAIPFVDVEDKNLWISFTSEGVALYNITQEKRLHPQQVTPLLDTTPKTSNEYTVGVQTICGEQTDPTKVVAINVNDKGEQEFIVLSSEAKGNTTTTS